MIKILSNINEQTHRDKYTKQILNTIYFIICNKKPVTSIQKQKIFNLLVCYKLYTHPINVFYLMQKTAYHKELEFKTNKFTMVLRQNQQKNHCGIYLNK